MKQTNNKQSYVLRENEGKQEKTEMCLNACVYLFTPGLIRRVLFMACVCAGTLLHDCVCRPHAGMLAIQDPLS